MSSILKPSFIVRLLLAMLMWFSLSGAALALPSFARQTGEACTACHVQTWGADLTPRGRSFKLKGYTESKGDGWIPPLSVVAEGGGFFNLDDNSSRRNYWGGFYQPQNRSYFTGSVYYAGKIAGPVGAYVEGSYAHDPESGFGTGFLNKVDLRFANSVNIGSVPIDYGISVNNEPGVQDLWNTNAVWTPDAVALISAVSPAPVADRRLSGYVAGASLYAMVNDWVYVEAGGYGALPSDVQRGIGRYIDDLSVNLDGGTAYWRIALQHEWGGHYVSLGHFGLQGRFAPPDNSRCYFLAGMSCGAVLSFNNNAFSDLGIDATYQYLANPEHIFELKGRYIRETTDWHNNVVSTVVIDPIHSFVNSYPPEITTESFNINGAYTWAQTLGISVGYQQYSMMQGTANLNFLTTGLSYTPFGKQNSPAAPWANLRLNLTYLTSLDNLLFYVPQDSLYLSGRLAF